MASRTVLARLTIDGVEGVVTGFKRAGGAVQEYARTSQKYGTAAGRWMSKHSDDINRASNLMLGFGAVGVAALGGLTKVSSDWETSWTGVTKTVDGSATQLDTLQQQLRDMARELPASHEEIAAVAEAAGQLGVQVDAVDDFTRTMINLGETTNLSAEEASSSLAQLMNIMGTAQTDVDRLGSSIVALGNNSATTEADIVAMSKRIAAVGRQMGMSESDVLALAASLASVGVEAEAGGTAVSNTMKRIDKAVREGGDSLDGFADIAGMSASDFRDAWEDDAATALASVAEGLGGMQAAGEDANGVLEDLGITGIRESDSLLRLASATQAAGNETDLLRDSLTLSAEAWETNTALAAEAEKRYQTTAAQAQISMNIMKDEAIDLGNELLPVFAGILSSLTSVVETLGGMPDGVKNAALALGGIVSVAALMTGGVGKMVVGLVEAKKAMDALGWAGRKALTTLGAFGAVLALAGLVVARHAQAEADAAEKIRTYTLAIQEQGEVIGATTREIAAQTLQDAGVLDIAEQYGANLADVTDAALGSEEALARVQAQVRGNSAEIESQIATNEDLIDSLSRKAILSDTEQVQLAALVTENQRLNGELSNRVSGVDEVVTAISDEKDAVAEAAEAQAQLNAAADDGTEAASAAAEAAAADAQAESGRAQAMMDAEQAQRDLLEATQQYGDALLQLSGSQIAVESAIDDVTAARKENGKTLDLDTEKGRANQRALDDLAKSSMSYISTLEEQGGTTAEITAATEKARDAWIEGATSMGMSREKAEELAAAYFAIPEDVTTTVATPGAKNSQREAEDLNRKLEGLPDEVRSEIVAIFDSKGADAADRRLDEISRDRTAHIRVVTTGVSSAPALGRTIQQANGGTVDYFADGAENHVAQIAPAGAWRVWAEPETGGEAYIPLAPEKRARSLDIWRETGRRLGAFHYADGMVVGSRPSNVSASLDPSGIEAAVQRGIANTQFFLGERAIDVRIETALNRQARNLRRGA